MKKLCYLILVAILALSMTACSKNKDIMIQDTNMGNLEHENVDVMGITYDLFENGYASIVYMLHKDAQISEKVSYGGKEYKVVAVGFEWDTYNHEWLQHSIFKDYFIPQNNSPENLTLPKSVKHIGAQALMGCTAEQISLPSQVEILAGRVFENCVNLESIEFPDSLEYLSISFGSCYSLKTMVLPDGCEHPSIDTLSGAFLDCYALESAVIPGDYKKLENMVFWNCNELTDVTLCEGIETIGAHVFGNCPKLTSLVIPESVTLIEGQAILNCPNLTDITLPDGLSDVPADMFLNEYSQPADVSNLTVRVEESMVAYVQSIYPTANVVAK